MSVSPLCSAGVLLLAYIACGPQVLNPDPVMQDVGLGQAPDRCCFEAGVTPAGALHT